MASPSRRAVRRRRPAFPRPCILASGEGAVPVDMTHGGVIRSPCEYLRRRSPGWPSTDRASMVRCAEARHAASGIAGDSTMNCGLRVACTRGSAGCSDGSDHRLSERRAVPVFGRSSPAQPHCVDAVFEPSPYARRPKGWPCLHRERLARRCWNAASENGTGRAEETWHEDGRGRCPRRARPGTCGAGRRV